MFENLTMFDYIMMGIAAPILAILALIIIAMLGYIFWPIIFGLFLVFVLDMPEPYLFIFGVVNFIWWITIIVNGENNQSGIYNRR